MRLEEQSIVRDWLAGMTEREIARKRNVSNGHVHKVLAGRELPEAQVVVTRIDEAVVVYSAMDAEVLADRVARALEKSGQHVTRATPAR